MRQDSSPANSDNTAEPDLHRIVEEMAPAGEGRLPEVAAIDATRGDVCGYCGGMGYLVRQTDGATVRCIWRECSYSLAWVAARKSRTAFAEESPNPDPQRVVEEMVPEEDPDPYWQGYVQAFLDRGWSREDARSMAERKITPTARGHNLVT